jgi:CBS domain-containing protein
MSGLDKKSSKAGRGREEGRAARIPDRARQQFFRRRGKPSMKITEFLAGHQNKIISCRRADTLQAAASLLYSNRIGAMPVVDSTGKLVGVLSERDIVSALSQRPAELMKLRVRDVMSAPPITAQCEADMDDAMKLMMSHKFRHLPIIDAEGRLRGMLSIRDCLAMQLRDKELEANVLRDSFIAARFS